MSDIFLATSFSGKVDYNTNKVLPEFRDFVEGALDGLRNLGGFTVFCAIEHEGWTIKEESPEVGVIKDLQEIIKASRILALVDKDPSAGVQAEVGAGIALGKQVTLATQVGTPLAYFNQGLVGANVVDCIVYGNTTELVAKVGETEGLTQGLKALLVA